MKICLLGGSNSVMKMGFNFGLCRDNDIQLALGVSSSIQNIHALVKNKDDVDACDIIVTESNVNDFHNINIIKLDKNLVFDNIASLYDELYRTGKTVVSVIIPVRINPNNVQSLTLFDEVNTLHRKLCKKYGFYLVDIQDDFSDLISDESNAKIIMKDTRHPLDSFMYMLGVNLREFLETKVQHSSRTSVESNFFTKDDFPHSEKSTKENSKFKRVTNKLSKNESIDETRGYLCGIETWCDGISQIKIYNDTRTVIKVFNSSLQFNEISCPNLTHFSIESHIGKAVKVTEPCVYINESEHIKHFVLITSMLFKKHNNKHLNIDINYINDISHIIPNKWPHISSVIKSSDVKSLYFDSNTINALRDSSFLLENVNLELAYQLMKLAKEMRPNGPFINKKLKEYEKKLNNQSFMD